MINLSETDKAYFAGLLDGEGWISIRADRYRRKSGQGMIRNSVAVGISNTDKKVLEWCKLKAGGGCLLKRNPDTPSHFGNRPYYQWTIVCKKAILLLNLILPYLKIKKNQASLAISFQLLLTGTRRNRVTKEMIQTRETLRRKLIDLNQKGHGVFDI